jgi:hypothetical protein
MKRLNRLARARPAQARAQRAKHAAAAATEERTLDLTAIGARGDAFAEAVARHAAASGQQGE